VQLCAVCVCGRAWNIISNGKQHFNRRSGKEKANIEETTNNQHQRSFFDY